jgi:membrane protease subunit HflC
MVQPLSINKSFWKKMVLIIIILVLISITKPWFTLDETEQGVILQFGKPIAVVQKSGFHLKLPYPLQVIYVFDKRILDYDSPPEEVITEDKKTLVIDNYVRWRIIDPLRFLQTVVSETGAMVRIDDIIYSELRAEIGRIPLFDLISIKRRQVMDTVTVNSNRKANAFGIEIIDVGIKRADLPKQNEEAVFQRMKTERERQAKQYRSEGQEEAIKLRAETDKEKTLIIAEAEKQSKIIRGQGEAKALRIYAEAFKQDPEFYTFQKTLETYEKTFNNKDVLILTPDTEFLHYLFKINQEIEK